MDNTTYRSAINDIVILAQIEWKVAHEDTLFNTTEVDQLSRVEWKLFKKLGKVVWNTRNFYELAWFKKKKTGKMIIKCYVVIIEFFNFLKCGLVSFKVIKRCMYQI